MKTCGHSGCYDRATARQVYGSQKIFRCPVHLSVNGRDTVWSAKGFDFNGKALK